MAPTTNNSPSPFSQAGFPEIAKASPTSEVILASETNKHPTSTAYPPVLLALPDIAPWLSHFIPSRASALRTFPRRPGEERFPRHCP